MSRLPLKQHLVQMLSKVDSDNGDDLFGFTEGLSDERVEKLIGLSGLFVPDETSSIWAEHHLFHELLRHEAGAEMIASLFVAPEADGGSRVPHLEAKAENFLVDGLPSFKKGESLFEPIKKNWEVMGRRIVECLLSSEELGDPPEIYNMLKAPKSGYKYRLLQLLILNPNLSILNKIVDRRFMGMLYQPVKEEVSLYAYARAPLPGSPGRKRLKEEKESDKVQAAANSLEYQYVTLFFWLCADLQKGKGSENGKDRAGWQILNKLSNNVPFLNSLAKKLLESPFEFNYLQLKGEAEDYFYPEIKEGTIGKNREFMESPLFNLLQGEDGIEMLQRWLENNDALAQAIFEHPVFQAIFTNFTTALVTEPTMQFFSHRQSGSVPPIPFVKACLSFMVEKELYFGQGMQAQQPNIGYEMSKDPSLVEKLNKESVEEQEVKSLEYQC